MCSSSEREEGRRGGLLEGLKNITSALLVIFSLLIVVLGLIYDANIADMGGSVSEAVLLLLAMILLAANEGFQVGVVSIHHMTTEEIRAVGFHRAAKTHSLMYEEGKGRLKQLLIGQSFMVVTCSFLIAQLTTFSDLTLSNLSIPSEYGVVNSLFFVFAQSGLPGVIITVTFAQLLPSIFAKEYPLHFLEIFGVYSIIRIALWIENVGVVKFVYAITYALRKFVFPEVDAQDSCGVMDSSCNWMMQSEYLEFDMSEHESPVIQLISTGSEDIILDQLKASESRTLNSNKNEDNRSADENIFQHIISCLQYCLSFLLTLFSLLFLGYGIYHGLSSFDKRVHPIVQMLILAFVLLSVFYCEGLKIAVVSTAHLDLVGIRAKGGNAAAVKVHQSLHFRSDCCRMTVDDINRDRNNHSSHGDLVKRFLLGRQQIVVPLGFLFAQITHFSLFPHDILPVYLYYPIVTVGIPGVLVLLQFAQLAPQLLAEERSITFLGLYGSYTLTRIALFIESLGITNFTWMLYSLLDGMMMKMDAPREDLPESVNVIDDNPLVNIELGYIGHSTTCRDFSSPRVSSGPIRDDDAVSV